MIHAAFERDGAGRLTAYRAEGHSDYAEAGYDIVCAAVSVLGATCVNSLEVLCGIEAELLANDEGILHFRLPAIRDPEKAHDAQLLMGALLQGLTDVAEQYPDELELST